MVVVAARAVGMTVSDFLGGSGPYRDHFQIELQMFAGERMVQVEIHIELTHFQHPRRFGAALGLSNFRLRVPAIVASVCGIVPLLPGLAIYRGLFQIVQSPNAAASLEWAWTRMVISSLQLLVAYASV